jgi:hypothetical protein
MRLAEPREVLKKKYVSNHRVETGPSGVWISFFVVVQ